MFSWVDALGPIRCATAQRINDVISLFCFHLRNYDIIVYYFIERFYCRICIRIY